MIYIKYIYYQSKKYFCPSTLFDELELKRMLLDDFEELPEELRITAVTIRLIFSKGAIYIFFISLSFCR